MSSTVFLINWSGIVWSVRFGKFRVQLLTKTVSEMQEGYRNKKWRSYKKDELNSLYKEQDSYEITPNNVTVVIKLLEYSLRYYRAVKQE